MLRRVVRFAGGAFGLLLDVAVTIFVVGAVVVATLLFLLMPSLIIPKRKPSEGFGLHRPH